MGLIENAAKSADGHFVFPRYDYRVRPQRRRAREFDVTSLLPDLSKTCGFQPPFDLAKA
jgi:hypothetical protein